MATSSADINQTDIVDLLTEKEVAAILRVSVSTLQQWRWRGIALPFLKVGSAVRYRRQDLDSYLAASLTTVDREM